MKLEEHRRTQWSVLGAIGAALAASVCCTIPLLFVILGMGGAWVGTFTALQPYRPLFIVLALVFLGYAGYREYRITVGFQCDCKARVQGRMRRAFLAVGLTASLGLIASPWIIHSTVPASTAGLPAMDAYAVQEVVLEIEGMTCAACNITVRAALTNLDGVEEARVTYEPPQAIVTYDPARVSVEQMVEATTSVGYPSRVKTKS